MDRGVVLSEVGRFDLEEIEVDAPGEGEVLVRIEPVGSATAIFTSSRPGGHTDCLFCWGTKERASWKRSAAGSQRLRREIASCSGGARRAVPAAGARVVMSAAAALRPE